MGLTYAEISAHIKTFDQEVDQSSRQSVKHGAVTVVCGELNVHPRGLKNALEVGSGCVLLHCR